MNIEELLKDIDEALSSINEETIDEKIMTKKQARRKKLLRAKRRAEKQARLQAEKEAQQKAEQEKQQASDNDVIEGEIVDDFSEFSDDEKNNIINAVIKEYQEDNTEGVSNGTSLVVYQEPNTQEDYTEITEEFLAIGEKLDAIAKTYIESCKAGMQEWEHAGKDKACPPETWEKLNTAIQTFKNETLQTIENTDLDKLAQPELILLDRYSTALNGYLEKAEQEIMAAKPNLTEDDFKAPTTTTGSDVVTTDDKQSTALTITGGDDNGNTTNTKVTKSKTNKPKIKDDTKHQHKLVTYGTWIKTFKPMNNAFGEILTALGRCLADKTVKTLATLALAPTEWITDTVFGFLTSPVAHDFVKTLMYSNPLTAMIFDGKLGKFGIGGTIEKVHNALKKKLGDARAANDPTKKNNKDNLTQRGFPKDISKMNLRQLKDALYGNRDFCECINIAFNHQDVTEKDKAALRKYTQGFDKAIKSKDASVARANLKELIELCDDICDNMSWEKPSDWRVLSRLAGVTKDAGKRGATNDELRKILSKKKDLDDADKKQAQTRLKDLLEDITTLLIEKKPKKEIITLLSDKENKDRKHNYSEEEITRVFEKAEKLIETKKQKQITTNKEHESYTLPIIKELNQLIESALA